MDAKITFGLAWCMSGGHDDDQTRNKVKALMMGWGRRDGEGRGWRGMGRVGRERVGGEKGKERKSGEGGVSKYKKKTVGDQPLEI